MGAKSGVYKPEFGNYSHVEGFITAGGQKGVQRTLLAPGTLLPPHPGALMVITSRKVYGLTVSPDLVERVRGSGGVLRAETFGLTPEQLRVVVIAPGGPQDMVGMVTAPEGEPLPQGDIASRLGGFDDIAAMEVVEDTVASQIIHETLCSKNTLHNNYQDFQRFLDNGGKIGLQHDP